MGPRRARLAGLESLKGLLYPGKKCERCNTTLVNVRRTYCTAKCRRLFNIARQEKRDAEKAEAVRKANADPNHLENHVKKVQREAEERRRALRGLS